MIDPGEVFDAVAIKISYFYRPKLEQVDRDRLEFQLYLQVKR